MNDIKVGRKLTDNMLEIWCSEQDIKRIFALDCVAAVTPSLANFELKKACCYFALIDARYDPENAVQQIEALNIEIPEAFRNAWEDRS